LAAVCTPQALWVQAAGRAMHTIKLFSDDDAVSAWYGMPLCAQAAQL